MNDREQRMQIQRLEAEIQKLAAAIELGRNVVPMAMAALVVAGIVILAVMIGKIGFDPAGVAGVLVALLIGIVFLAWHRRRLGIMAGLLKSIEADKAELAGKIGPGAAGED